MSDLDLIIDRMKDVTHSQTEVQLASYLGLKSKSAVSTWKTRAKKPLAECLAISQNENISLDWLLTGQGNMHKSASSVVTHEDLTLIPEYDIALSAGYGAYPQDHALAIGNRPFSTAWLKKKGLKPQSLSLVRVAGDSMEPLLKDKDMVLIDGSRIKPSEAMPYAIRLDDELLVKTIQRQGDGNIALVSRNKAYDNIIIDPQNPPQDFQIIGAVVWHAHSWI